MLSYDFENSVGFWLVAAHQAYMRTFNEKLAPQGVTFRQAQVLGWLAIEGPQSQADLAARMMIEPPSLVGVLDRMERDGLIQRLACPEDRRKKLVAPLPAAEQVFQRIALVGREMRTLATHGLSEREVATLKSLLTRVQNNVCVNSAECGVGEENAARNISS